MLALHLDNDSTHKWLWNEEIRGDLCFRNKSKLHSYTILKTIQCSDYFISLVNLGSSFRALFSVDKDVTYLTVSSQCRLGGLWEILCCHSKEGSGTAIALKKQNKTDIILLLIMSVASKPNSEVRNFSFSVRCRGSVNFWLEKLINYLKNIRKPPQKTQNEIAVTTTIIATSLYGCGRSFTVSRIRTLKDDV